MVHEIGNRTYVVAPVEPLDLDGIRTMQVGTALWAVAFVLLLPFYGRLEDDGHLWWLWTCVAGFGLGLVGLGPHPAAPQAAARARGLTHDLSVVASTLG